jgi:hypothetical protein
MKAKDTTMKRNTIAKTLTIAGVAAFALCLAPAAKADDKGCTNASLRGTFIFTGTGFFTSPPALAGPFAEVGTQTFDGRGNTTYAATLSQNGNLVKVTATGTYTVNPDCTGTITVLVSPFAATVHVSFVIDGTGSEFQAIETDSGVVITRIGRRQFPAGDWRNQ